MYRYCRKFAPCFIYSIFLFSCFNSIANAIDTNDQVPPFTLPKLTNGEEFSIEEYRGKYVYIDFWASWCGPCRKSLPALNELRKTFNSKNFEIVAINVDENHQDGLDFLKKYPVDYLVLHDPKARTPKLFSVPGMPTAYLISPEGKVLKRHVGFRKGDKQKIEKLLTHYLEEEKEK